MLCHAPDCFRLSPPWAFPLCDHWVCRRQRAELSPWISTSGGIFSSVKSSSFYACANQSPKHWSEVGHRDVRKDTVQTMKASHLVEINVCHHSNDTHGEQPETQTTNIPARWFHCSCIHLASFITQKVAMPPTCGHSSTRVCVSSVFEIPHFTPDMTAVQHQPVPSAHTAQVSRACGVR